MCLLQGCEHCCSGGRSAITSDAAALLSFICSFLFSSLFTHLCCHSTAVNGERKSMNVSHYIFLQPWHTYSRDRKYTFWWLIFFIHYCQTPSGIVVVVAVAGPKEAQGHARNLLINSQSDNMLFTADGDQTVIGPDKLRVTGIKNGFHLLFSWKCHTPLGKKITKQNFFFPDLEKDNIDNRCELNRSYLVWWQRSGFQ